MYAIHRFLSYVTNFDFDLSLWCNLNISLLMAKDYRQKYCFFFMHWSISRAWSI